MKLQVLIQTSLILATTSITAMDPRFQSITEAELFGYGDFNGNGQLDGIVIDRASGFIRVLSTAGDSSLHWTDPIVAGIQKVDTFSVGPVSANGRDQLALGGVMANRTHILALDAEQPLLEAVFTGGVGHRDIVLVDLGLTGNDPARMDLLIATGWFDQAATVATFQATPAGLGAALTESATASLQRAHARVRMLDSGKDYLLYLSRANPTGSESAILIDPLSPAAPPLGTVPGIAHGSRFIHGPLLNGAANQFLFYVPNSDVIQISTTLPGTYLQTPVTHLLPFPVGSLHLIRDSDAWGFIAIAADGQLATFYRLNASLVPVAMDSMSAAAGNRFSGALAREQGQLTLLLSNRADGQSTDSVHFEFSSNQWQQIGGGPLPAIGPFLALPNVLLFAGEPFVNPEAALTAAVRVGDWTRNAEIASGGAVSVITESLSANGLTGSIAANAGSAPIGTTHAWTNQLSPSVSLTTAQSLFGPQAPMPEIIPQSGVYDRYFRIQISTTDTAATIRYRFGNSGPWLSAAGSVSVDPPGGTLLPVDVYAFADKNGIRSPIWHAAYSFYSPTGPLDSDNDGVPDYVELAFGLDPLAGPDTDGDGFSDLRELLAGTDAGDGEDFPSSWARIAAQTTFNLALQPLSFDSFSTLVPSRPSYPASSDPSAPAGTRVRAYDLDGRLLASATSADNPGDGLPGISVLLNGLPAEPQDAFIVLISDPSFPIQPDASVNDPLGERDGDRGIELVGLLPVPRLELPAVPYTPALGTNPATAANAWLAAAQAHFAGLQSVLIAQPFTYLDTLKLLLTERILALLLADRSASFNPDSFSLTSPRDTASASAQTHSASAILSLQNSGTTGIPAYRLHEIFTTVNDAIDTPPNAAHIHLRTLAREIYFSAATQASETSGLYPSVVDALRGFLRGQNLPGFPDTSYASATSLNNTQLNAARSVAGHLKSQIAPREQQLFVAAITESSFNSAIPQLVQIPGAQPLQLLDSFGQPFPFPTGLPLLPGTELHVQAFNDRTENPFHPNQAVEVIQVQLSQLPPAAPVDRDQNGLDDNWERLFFGRSGIHPFADADGDGVTNLEESLRGTHPRRADSVPSVATIPQQLPPVDVRRLPNGDFALRVRFPTEFSGQLGFRLQIADSPSGNFFETTALAQPHHDGTYTLQVSPPANFSANFYRFRIFLR